MYTFFRFKSVFLFPFFLDFFFNFLYKYLQEFEPCREWEIETCDGDGGSLPQRYLLPSLVSNTDFALVDLEEGEKESALYYHSEKLAIA